jgi:diaminopimelate epimerase
VEFVWLAPQQHIVQRTYERGSGETLACGTGACAAVAIGRRHGPLAEEVRVDTRGGRLIVGWRGPGEPIWLTGPAETAFEGHVELQDYLMEESA